MENHYLNGLSYKEIANIYYFLKSNPDRTSNENRKIEEIFDFAASKPEGDDLIYYIECIDTTCDIVNNDSPNNIDYLFMNRFSYNRIPTFTPQLKSK